LSAIHGLCQQGEDDCAGKADPDRAKDQPSPVMQNSDEGGKIELGRGRISPLPWAETRSRFTLLMERMIIDVIRHCSTISGTCAIMRVSWDEAFGVMQRAVMRGKDRKEAKEAAIVKHIGVDEKAFRKGHSYLTVVCDLEQATV